MVDRKNREMTQIWCTNESMEFSINKLSMHEVLFVISGCMIIVSNGKGENSVFFLETLKKHCIFFLLIKQIKKFGKYTSTKLWNKTMHDFHSVNSVNLSTTATLLRFIPSLFSKYLWHNSLNKHVDHFVLLLVWYMS